MRRELYDECVRLAAKSSRNAQQARDLAHAVLSDLIARGSMDERRAFLFGALRNRAAFEARTAARRRAREERWQTAHQVGDASVQWRFSIEMRARLSPALRVVAALAAADLTPREIRWVLRLTETAFRKRVSELGRAVRSARAAGIEVVTRPAATYALGPARAELLASVRKRPACAVASHDPDGHPIIFSRIGAHEQAANGNSRS